MKTAKILATFALLAGVTAHAVTVSFESGATSAVNLVPPGGAVGSPVANTPYTSLTFTNGGGSVTTTGYYWNAGVGANEGWRFAPVRFQTSATATTHSPVGVGVSENSTYSYVSGSLQEYILLDFGGGTSTVSSIKLYLSNVDNQSQYFTYAWLNTAPVLNSTIPDIPLTLYGTAPTPVYSGTGPYTFDMATTGAGRYLLLGANNPDTGDESRFTVQQVTYTRVADGASTLALLGAAVGSLGLAARRRRL
jgi:hypothetical protein